MPHLATVHYESSEYIRDSGIQFRFFCFEISCRPAAAVFNSNGLLFLLCFFFQGFYFVFPWNLVMCLNILYVHP